MRPSWSSGGIDWEEWSTNCETLEDLKTILTNRYRTKKTIPQIQNKLSKFIQGNDSIRNYSDKILELIELNELKICELRLLEQSDINNVKRLNELLALNTFKQGLNEKFISTVFAAIGITIEIMKILMIIIIIITNPIKEIQIEQQW